MKMKSPIVAITLLMLALSSVTFAAEESAETAAKPTLKPRVKMVTSLGDIVLELDGEKAPITVNNFVTYAEEGFFNGTVFHRVKKTFMIQGGQLDVNMDEKMKGLHPPIKNEGKNGLKNVRGTISMARTPALDSATAQFFINVVDNGMLDSPSSPYAVFGKVVEGLETVDKIKNTPVAVDQRYARGTGGAVTPVTPVVIKSVTLLDKFDKEAVKAQIAKAAAAAAAAKAEAAKGQIMELQSAITSIEAKLGVKLDIKTTPSGLQYAVIKEGDGPSPKATDTVKVHYRGTETNGEEFDSSYKRGTPATFPLNGVIKGWTEGVGLMKTGGKSLLICPSDLAYGPRGHQLSGKTLIFEVELLGIE